MIYLVLGMGAMGMGGGGKVAKNNSHGKNVYVRFMRATTVNAPPPRLFVERPFKWWAQVALSGDDSLLEGNDMAVPSPQACNWATLQGLDTLRLE